MRSGNGDTLLQAHQFSQHLRTRHYRHLLFASRYNFRVVGLDRSRDDDGIGSGNVSAGVADAYINALRSQTPCHRTFGNIRTGHREAEVGQDFGNSAHAGTTDADEVDVFDLVFHFTSSMQAMATISVASGLASSRARSAICCSCSRL